MKAVCFMAFTIIKCVKAGKSIHYGRMSSEREPAGELSSSTTTRVLLTSMTVGMNANCVKNVFIDVLLSIGFQGRY